MNPPKYRLLKQDELDALKTKFAYFLSAQSIEAKDWEKMKSENEKKAIEYLVSFSDFIYEDLLSNIQYVINQTNKMVDVVHCQPSQMIRMRVESSNPALDLSSLNLLDKSAYKSSNQLRLSMHERKYSDVGREMEIFRLLENNYRISDGELYKILCLMIAEDAA